jgi:hypothetical protein
MPYSASFLRGFRWRACRERGYRGLDLESVADCVEDVTALGRVSVTDFERVDSARRAAIDAVVNCSALSVCVVASKSEEAGAQAKNIPHTASPAAESVAT